MVDKKLSEFSSVQASDVSDLVVLYLDGNNTIKNGRMSFQSFVSGLALLSGNNTFTGDNTFSGDAVFSGNATFNLGINGVASRATADASGNNIENTYATKTELDQKSSFKLFHHDWFDYQLNDMAWLRADTFSWQDGTVYSEAYNHLVADYNGGTSQTETVGSYTITYVLANDGHKITTDETNVANIYNESGVAWYYILDKTNQRFKLPRGLHGIVVQSYQNGENWYRIYSDGWCEQGGVSPTAGDQTNNTIMLLKSYKDTNYSILFAQNAGVEGQYTNGCTAKNKTTSSFVLVYRTGGNASFYWQACGYISGDFNDLEKYLYFYVGQFSQSATEQTAGLNSELFNGKLDLNAQNLSTQGKSLISGLGMPSSTYDNLTLGASGTNYTAPANGWFYIRKKSGGSNLYLNIGSNDNFISITASSSNQDLTALYPCKNGDSISVTYNASGTTTAFKFIYAEGEV